MSRRGGGLAAHPAKLVPQRNRPIMHSRYRQSHITYSGALMLYQRSVRFRRVRQTCQQREHTFDPPSHNPSSAIPSSHHHINSSTHHPYTCKWKCTASTMRTIKLVRVFLILLSRRSQVDDLGPLAWATWLVTDQSPTRKLIG